MQILGSAFWGLRRGTLTSRIPETDSALTRDVRATAGTSRLRHIPELDGLRGVAALMVFLHHVCFSTVPDGAWSPAIQLVRHVSLFGANGVALFFVLSGFLITSILIGNREKPSYYAPFYWKRVLRIVPVYVVMLLYIVLFERHTTIAVVCAVLFVANFSWFFHVVPVMPFWSLAIEEQFYLLWPTVVHRQRVPGVAAWALAVGLGSIACRLIFACFGHYNIFFTPLNCDGLAWGALLACFYVSRGQARGGGHGIIAGAFALAAGTFLLNYFLPMTSQAWLATNVALSVTGIAFLSLGVVSLLVFASGAWWLAIFRSPILIFFGLISYAFYMVHLYVIMAYDRRWGLPAAPDAHGYWVRVLLTFTVATGIATASRYLLELPAIRLRRFIPSLRGPGA